MSNPPMMAAHTIIKNSTIPVLLSTCFFVGQTTRFISPRIPRIPRAIRVWMPIFSAPAFALDTINSYLSALGSLFCFFVWCVFAAKAAKLVHFQTVGVAFFVFHSVVIALFALGARKGNLDSHGCILLVFGWRLTIGRGQWAGKQRLLPAAN